MRPSGRLPLAFLILMSCPVAARAFDGGAWTVRPGEWYSEVSGTRLYASQQFGVDARDGAIPSEGRFQQYLLTSYNELGWKKNVSLVLGVPFSSRTWRFYQTTRTISGLADLRLGFRIRLRDDAPGLILDGGWLAPSGYDKNVFPKLGDGRQKVWGALNGGIKLPGLPGFGQASRGVLFVSEDGVLYSQTSADAAVWIGSHVLFGARYSDDVAWSSALESSRLGTAYRAGPVLLLRVDDRMDLSIGAGHQWYGRNALEFTGIYLALGFKQTKLNPMQGFLGTRQHP